MPKNLYKLSFQSVLDSGIAASKNHTMAGIISNRDGWTVLWSINREERGRVIQFTEVKYHFFETENVLPHLQTKGNLLVLQL